MAGFDGKIAFVTGGGTGIGFACAQAIADRGGTVMIAGRREDVLRASVARLAPTARWVRCDVTEDASVERAVAETVERFGALHVAVNAAGTGAAGTVLNTRSGDFAGVLETNLVGTFRCVRAEAKAMRAAGGGSIVNVSSIAAVLTHRWMTAYCVAKAGVNMLTRCAADDLGEHGIRVNAVMPSLVPTELASFLSENAAARDEYLRLMPISRLGTPEDVAAVATFLLSDDAGWITGQCIGVDGGHTIRKGPDLVSIFRGLLPEET